MSIEIPEEEIAGAAVTLRTEVATALAAAHTCAAAADLEVEGILHQPASSKLEAIFQKLGGNAEDGDDATVGLATGMDDVVTKFGEMDRMHGGGPR